MEMSRTSIFPHHRSFRNFFFRPTLPIRKYPSKSSKFTILPLTLQNKAIAVFSSSTSCCSSSSTTMESPPEGYRRNVEICLINQSNKVFAASRLDIPSAWQMPQGGIDKNEDPRVAALRELKEETGISSAEVVDEDFALLVWMLPAGFHFGISYFIKYKNSEDLKKKVPYWLTYDFPTAEREKLKVQWGSDWKGQAQKWFLLKFTGKDEEVNLLGDGTEKPKFGEWAWMSPEQVIYRAVDFKKPVYQEVLSVFAPHLQ